MSRPRFRYIKNIYKIKKSIKLSVDIEGNCTLEYREINDQSIIIYQSIVISPWCHLFLKLNLKKKKKKDK